MEPTSSNDTIIDQFEEYGQLEHFERLAFRIGDHEILNGNIALYYSSITKQIPSTRRINATTIKIRCNEKLMQQMYIESAITIESEEHMLEDNTSTTTPEIIQIKPRKSSINEPETDDFIESDEESKEESLTFYGKHFSFDKDIIKFGPQGKHKNVLNYWKTTVLAYSILYPSRSKEDYDMINEHKSKIYFENIKKFKLHSWINQPKIQRINELRKIYKEVYK